MSILDIFCGARAFDIHFMHICLDGGVRGRDGMDGGGTGFRQRG